VKSTEANSGAKRRRQVADTAASTCPLLRSRGEIDVSNDATPFWIVTDGITCLGVTQTSLLLLLYKRQLLFLMYSDSYSLMYEAGIALLMCRVQLFLLDSPKQTLLVLVRSLLDVSAD
jgi:hypothetical protein